MKSRETSAPGIGRIAQAVLRDAREADIRSVQAIYAFHVLNGTNTFEEIPPDAAEMTKRREVVIANRLPYVVAEIAGEIRGFAYAAPFRPRSAYRYTVEDSIYLHPAIIGQGLGRLLLAALIKRCTGDGYRQMVAVIGDSSNLRSIRLHARLGFEHVGRLTAAGYKFGRWLDAVFM